MGFSEFILFSCYGWASFFRILDLDIVIVIVNVYTRKVTNTHNHANIQIHQHPKHKLRYHNITNKRSYRH